MSHPVVRFVVGRGAAIAPVRPYTVVYDGTCGICNRLIALLEHWDRARLVESVPFQNTSVRARFPWIPAEAFAEAVQLVGPNGRTWQGSAAIEEILRLLPVSRALGRMFAVPLAGPLLDRLYRWFAVNRYQFGCGEHCQSRPPHLEHGEGGHPIP